ncbi:ribosomal protein S18-alanine N-acetyltransferase [Candidatus Margulisiibacteriota bacterium]
MEIKETTTGPHHHLILQIGNEVIGTLDWDQAAEETQLIDISIHEGYRRKGHGEYLLKAMLAQAKKRQLKKVLLEVRASNKPAIALYNKCGFRRSGARKAYYSGPKDDALLFELIIQL